MKIFISSTYLDLITERKKAINIIDRIGQAIAMEKWFAEAKAPKEVALNKLKECNAVVLILGFKYGSIDKDKGISITEIEYDTAKSLGLPVFVFQKRHFDGRWESEEEDEEIDTKLTTFKYRLDSEDNHRVTFKTPQELATEIMGSIYEYNDIIGSSASVLNEEFTDEWFKKNLDIATSDLGERYNHELNFELGIAKIFDGIARDKKFEEQFRNRLNEFIIKLRANNFNIADKIIEENKEKLQDDIELLVKEYHNIPFNNVDSINYDEIIKITNEIESILSKIENRINELKRDTTEKNELQIFDTALYHLRDTIHPLESFGTFINSDTAKLANKPFLLLDGEAGIGKSHLLADIANKRLDEGKNTILLLGQHLTNNEDPWTQISKELKLDCSVDEFLGALELKAQIQGSRILIFIDAINEGSGKLFWPDRLSGFITSFQDYKWLGLVLSIRTSYVKLIAPKNDNLNNLIIRHTHYGFRNVEYEASKLFLENYKIEQPSVPLLNPEFQNPLFLKIFCDGLKKSGLTRIPDGMQGITKITNFFIKAINNRLSLPKEFNYPESINMVDKAVKKLIEYKLDNDLCIMPYEEAFKVITNLEKEYNIANNFIEGLISEGIISKNLYWKDEEHEEIIYIAYERFEDHITASYLLDNIDGKHLEKEFENGGKLHKFVKDSWAVNYYDGLIEALSVQIPERFEKELYELIPDFNDLKEIKRQDIEYDIAEAFVSSLLWRKHSKIDKKVLNYINEVVMKFHGTFELFWETIISVSSLPSHPFNANKIHSILYENKLPNRDSWWNELIEDNYRNKLSVKRIIDWSWSSEDRTYISDESIKLSSIMISWFLTSTNRELRDSATKAIICLLKDRIEVLIEVLTKFEGVDDPYIYERLFAVAYGCALRTKNTECLKELSEYIYKTIFDKDLVYPHVLLRDYACGVIEYTLHLRIKLNIDINKIRSPYKSSFPRIPSDEEIEVYKFNYDSEDFKDHFWSQNNILDSMEVERTREGRTASYGNFGRYEFQFNFENWIELEPVDLKNIAIKRIFDLGYNVEKHGKFDRKIRRFEHRYLTTERIGKKYQLIAMHELLAQVADEYQMEAPWLWKDKKMVNFQGPWEPFIRNIDPTVLKRENPSKIPIFDEICGNWEGNPKSWLQEGHYPDPLEILNISLDDEEWFILEGNFDWREPELFGNPRYSYPSKRLWCQIRSYLVKESDFDSIIQWSKDKNFMNRWMPESHENTHVFNREYYWSPAFKYFQKDYYEGELVKKIHDRKTGKIVGDVIPTAEMYWWESGDKSIEDSFRLLKPCNEIYYGLNLKYGKEEGVLYSQNDKKICYDLSEFYSISSTLIIRKDNFLEFLENSNYRIFWTVLGEKNIIGGKRSDYGTWPSISGVYYLNKNGNLTGTFTKFES